MTRALVIGAGVAGSAAALELARLGIRSTVIESSPLIGGKVLSYCCKAADSCTRCGACTAHELVAEAVRNPRIDFLTSASVRCARRNAGGFAVEAAADLPALNPRKCTDCGACVKACPARCIARHDRGGLVQYGIDRPRCRLSRGGECTACAKACPSSAIRASAGAAVRLNAGAVLLAVGHEAFDPAVKPRLGYGRVPGVMTGLEAEERLARGGSLFSGAGRPGERRGIAFIQCVGSRDPKLGRNWCSAVCCAYALRMASRIAGREPGVQVTVYCIDVQNFDKAFTSFRADLAKSGVEIIHGLPSAVQAAPGGGVSLWREDARGRADSAVYDAVVLSVGLGPAPGSAEIAGLFGVPRDAFGFLAPSDGRVFCAGTCREPQGIMESIAEARAAAFDMFAVLKPDADASPEALGPSALVIGDGETGMEAARLIRLLGHPVTVIGGRAGDAARLSAAQWDTPRGVDHIPDAALRALDGAVGGFRAALSGLEGETERVFGAAVIAAEPSPRIGNTFFADRVVPLEGLQERLSRPWRRGADKSLGIILDLEIEEGTESFEEALRACIEARSRLGLSAAVIVREARVSQMGMEALYDEARAAGVCVTAYDGVPVVETDGNETAVVFRDPVLGETARIRFGLLALSGRGLAAAEEAGLSAAAGIGMDAQGRLQENNVRLLPARTGRPGVFAVGACRGENRPSAVARDVKNAALDVHYALTEKHRTRNREHPVVDADLCALCLTCVRSCPAKAMGILAEEKRADCNAAACLSCGTCIGECPAGAISIPAQPRRAAGAS